MASKFDGFHLRDKAQQKLMARREAAASPPTSAGMGITRPSINSLGQQLLVMDADELMPASSNDTFAIGLYEGNKLIVAAKGVPDGDFIATRIAAKLSAMLGSRVDPEATESIASGLHSEMAIVSHVLKKMSGSQKENAFSLRYVLQIICIGKGVCPDCAGYMNKYGIPHFSLQRDKIQKKSVVKSFENGKPSAGGLWTHPRTGAIYQSRTNKKEGAVLEGWHKNGQSAKLY